jgi:hypothetical protein
MGHLKVHVLEVSYFSSVVENLIDRVASFKLLCKQTKGYWQHCKLQNIFIIETPWLTVLVPVLQICFNFK